MTFIGSRRPVATAVSGVLAVALSGCDSLEPVELRCAAFFHQLSERKPAGDVPASQQAAYRQHSLAFIDRLPGDRAEKIAAMRGISDSLMADDGLRNQCDQIIPLQQKSLKAA